MFNVVHEFPHALPGEAVAQSMRPAALAERLHAGPGKRRAERLAAADVVALQVAAVVGRRTRRRRG